MTDLHIHTRLSYDSGERAENFISSAKSQGFTRLGFSEHYDYDVYLSDGCEKAALPDLEEYDRTVSALKCAYPQMKILKGIELGYCKNAVPYYNALLRGNNFDYAILSVHTLPERGDCYYPEFYAGLSKKQAYEKYFETVLESARSDVDYQIIGHIGYIERYAPYPDKSIVYQDFADILDQILNEIIARGKCLEINTSVKGTNGITLPGFEIIDRYIRLGGENFTLGSDAHSANRFAENFSAVKEFLLSRGINHTCVFEKGKLFKEKL